MSGSDYKAEEITQLKMESQESMRILRKEKRKGKQLGDIYLKRKTGTSSSPRNNNIQNINYVKFN